jgi:hypothetical protein
MRTLAAILIFLNVFDAVATYYAVSIGHYAYEANPVMVVMQRMSWWLFFSIKLALGALSCKFLLYTGEFYPRIARGILSGGIVVYTTIAVYHVYGFINYGRNS